MVCTILLCIQKDNFVHPWGPYVWVNVYLKKHSCVALEMCIVKLSKYTTASGLFDQFVITESIVLFPKHATKRKNLICNRHILYVRSTGYSIRFVFHFVYFPVVLFLHGRWQVEDVELLLSLTAIIMRARIN